MNNRVNNKKNSGKKVINIITDIVIALYVVLVLILSVSVFSSMRTGYPSVFGYSLLYVRTDSMESDAPDAIFEGDLVLCKEYEHYEDLKIDKVDGDIIAYKTTVYQEDDLGNISEHEIVRIHRIVDTDENGVRFITRGDNSPDEDNDGEPDNDGNPVNPSNILGVYEGTRIPGAGKVFDFLQSQNGILFCLVIPMAAFFIYALFKFVKAMIDYKLEKATSGAPAADGELTEEQKQAAIAEYLAKQAAEANKEENNTDQKSE